MYGIFFEGCWYTRKEFTFFTKDAEDQIQPHVEDYFFKTQNGWEGHYFQNIPEFRMEIDYEAVNKKLSIEYAKPVNVLHDFEKMQKYFDEVGHQQRPLKRELQYPVYRQFVGQPWLVGYEKEEKKRAINTQFESYATNEIFYPFAIALNKLSPSEFYQITLLIHGSFTKLIYPHAKTQILTGMTVADKKGVASVYYCLFVTSERKFYEWTLPKPRKIMHHGVLTVREDIKPLLSPEDGYDMDDPAITLDDGNF